VVINKIDRPDCRAKEVLSQTFDLFVELGADDQALEFPVYFLPADGGLRHARTPPCPAPRLPAPGHGAEHVPGPEVEPDAPLQMMVTTLAWSEYVGRIATGGSPAA